MAVVTNTDGRGRRWWTAGKRVAAVVVISIVGLGGSAAVVFNSEGNPYASLDNSGGTMVNGVGYNQYADTPMADLPVPAGAGPYGAFENPDFTFDIDPDSAGPHPTQGQFRLLCDWSHIAQDDPIIFPNEPGRSHTHIFWGNTEVNADSTLAELGTGSEHDVLNRGGSTCAGNVLNRSAYWMPAMFDGPAGPGRQIVAPKAITLYYKSNRPAEVERFPQGIQLLVGNIPAIDPVFNGESFAPGEHLHWGCYSDNQGATYGPSWSGTIPTNCNDVGPACPPGNCDIQASIQFPQCITGDLTSADFVSHTVMLYNYSSNFGVQNDPCPATHPVRVPQISYLVRFETRPDAEVERWRLSSDTGWEGSSVPFPGGSLHGDWFGAWHEPTNQAWLDGCFLRAAGPENCSLGQTGQDLGLVRFSPLLLTTNPGYHPDPCPTCRPLPG